jgi:hypothetical protein
MVRGEIAADFKSKLTACLTTGTRRVGRIVSFPTGMHHSSFYALCAPSGYDVNKPAYELSDFGRAMISIQVMHDNPQKTKRTDGGIWSFSLEDTQLLRALALDIAAMTKLHPAKQPLERATWALEERTGFLLGTDVHDSDLKTRVGTVLAKMYDSSSAIMIRKVHLLLSGTIRGQVTA